MRKDMLNQLIPVSWKEDKDITVTKEDIEDCTHMVYIDILEMLTHAFGTLSVNQFYTSYSLDFKNMLNRIVTQVAVNAQLDLINLNHKKANTSTTQSAALLLRSLLHNSRNSNNTPINDNVRKLQEVARVLAAHSENKEENISLVENLIAAINYDNETGEL